MQTEIEQLQQSFQQITDPYNRFLLLEMASFMAKNERGSHLPALSLVIDNRISRADRGDPNQMQDRFSALGRDFGKQA